jgi:pre-mycofactocin synthase
VLDILRGGIDSALMGLGRASVHDLCRDDIVMPPRFARALGVSTAGGQAPPPVGPAA